MNKRDLIATWSNRLGLTFLLEHAPKRPSLLVLNYHRIGSAQSEQFDPALFSASAEAFDEQIRYLAARFPILSLEEAVTRIRQPRGLQRPSILITFDDGYLDNYSLAFPILRSHRVPASFFLPTSFIGTHHIPWWDEVAYMLRHSQRRRFVIESPERREFDLDQQDFRWVLREVLRLYKSPSVQDTVRFVDALRDACQGPRPPEDSRLFMSWEEAVEMKQGGMDIGSHTHSHQLLSKLSLDEQRRELTTSRQELESRLHGTVDVVAYPVGAPTAFSPATTYPALEQAGYRAAFSFYGGVNQPGSTHPFNILRCGIGNEQSLSRIRFQVAVATSSRRYWL